MPRVPTYDTPQQQTRPLPAFQQRSAASPALFSAGAEQTTEIGRSLMAAGTVASDIAVKMQERENADMIFRAETALKDDWLKFEQSVRERRGQNAWGATADAEKWFEEQGKQHSQILTNDVQRGLFGQSLARLRTASMANIARYEGEQRKVSLEEAATASIAGSINQAAASVDESGSIDPTLAAGTKSDVSKRIQVLAEINGWAPERKQFEEGRYLTTLHKQVLQAMLAKDPAKAEEYYKANKEEIDGADRDGIEKAIEATGEAKKGQDAVDRIITSGMTEADALEYVRKNFEGKLEDDVNVRVRAFFAQQEQARERAQRAANEAGWAHFDKTGKMPPPNVVAGMDPRTRIEMRRVIRAQAEGHEVKTDMATWLDVNNRIAAGEQVNLLDYRGRLSPGDIKHFAGKMASPEKVLEARMDSEDFNTLADRAGLHPFKTGQSEDEKRALGTLKQAVEQRINYEQQTRKRVLTRDEKQTVMQQVIDNQVMVESWGPDTAKPAAMMAPKELEDAYVMVNKRPVRLKDIPADERLTIIRKRRQYGLPVTEQAIAESWLKKQEFEKSKPQGNW